MDNICIVLDLDDTLVHVIDEDEIFEDEIFEDEIFENEKLEDEIPVNEIPVNEIPVNEIPVNETLEDDDYDNVDFSSDNEQLLSKSDDNVQFTSNNCSLSSHYSNLSFKDLNGRSLKVKIAKRPHFDEFIDFCFNIGKVGVWSMGQPSYVKGVVKTFFNRTPHFVYDWSSCDRIRREAVKDLDKIEHSGKIIMIDDSPNVIRYTKENIHYLCIKRWNGKSNDDDKLLRIMDEIKKLF